MVGPRKIDYLIGAIVGLATVLFALPAFININAGGAALIVGLFAAIPPLWIFGLWFGKFLLRWISFGYQFSKFVVVGFLNAAIDFGVLNIVSLFTGVTSGFVVGGVNVPGFVMAATNSYLWNKFWVFRKEREPGEKVNYSDIFSFLVIVVIGIFINGGIVILISTYISPWWNFSPERWLNIAKVVASAFSLGFNFIGFKWLVFKPKYEIKQPSIS